MERITARDLECMLCDEMGAPKALPLSLLEEITDGFSDEKQIGSGGFAVVYKGKLESRTVAVKRLSNMHMDEKEFHQEVECLMMVKHKNIVRFLGYCANRQGSMERYNGKLVMADVHQRLLCFEYLPRGSLHDYITDTFRGLQWRDRYQIIIGICQGLHHLHQRNIVHLDLKPANILLDDNLVPKIADFGLSRCFDEIQSRVITVKAGTRGYMAPEFFNHTEITYRHSSRLDIYSLGVIIIEILTGKRGYHAVDDVVKSWSNVLEQSLSDIQLQQVRVCAEIGIECVDFNPSKRLNIQHIIDRLGETDTIDEYIETGAFTSQHANDFSHELHQDTPNVLGETSSEENATALDFPISRRDLKKRIERVESTVSEVKQSPFLAVTRKSAPNDTGNKNRSRIRTASKRKVFGREVLRDDIMAMLRETPQGDAQSSSTSLYYSVIGIYGVAGSGKTTFARYIRDYIKEECKEKLFDTIMCINVSETFSVDDIFHEILKDITRDRHSNILDHEELEEKLKEALHGKRFLLILDDLWVKNKNDPQLEEIISPLNAGVKGSKVLVTARTKDAAIALCANEPIQMPNLDEDHYLSMFMHYALGDTTDAHEEFVRVGREIAKKIHPSPIAAVTVAGQIGKNRDIKFWKSIAKLDVLNDPMSALRWRYSQLNPDIRRCFEYCCNIFPRRSRFGKENLVCLWIAQDFVKTSCATEHMEDVAEGYIQELVSCSFLQPEGRWCGTDSFTVHDLLHDLLKDIGSDCFRIENARCQRGETWKGDVPRDVSHLFVLNYDSKLVREKILGLKNLRTLIIYVVDRHARVEEKVIDSICRRLPNLRVLAVAFSQEHEPIKKPQKFSVPESISQLKHLCYLAFRTSYSCEVILPSALTKLHHIQMLDFGDGQISEFPLDDLINLRHKICGSDVECPNIGRLIPLQRRSKFTLKNEQASEVKQLSDLNKLDGKLRMALKISKARRKLLKPI